MPTLLILITVMLYGAALLLWVRFRTYRYLVVLLAGHLTMVSDPIWQRLYDFGYPAGSSGMTLWGRTVPLFMVLSASWLATLPAMVMYFGQRQRWWPRHYLSGVVAFVALLLYHIILQGLARRLNLWDYSSTASSWGLSHHIFVALLGALVSLLILYTLVATRYYAAELAIPALVAGIAVAPVLAYGILGAPYWLPILIGQSTTIIKAGAVVTVLLTAWVVHLACWGLHASRKQLVINQ